MKRTYRQHIRLEDEDLNVSEEHVYTFFYFQNELEFYMNLGKLCNCPIYEERLYDSIEILKAH